MAGIYIHIPFCRQACHYCNFHFSTSLQLQNDFISALLEEIKIRSNYLGNEQVNTVYFGGGTPSLLSAEDLAKIFRALNGRFTISGDAEITLEANPDDITREKLDSWKQVGVNRLSIGVQSFFDEDLKWMNRAHDAGQALNCIEFAQTAGFENLSIDLIYGGPTLPDERWIRNLELATSFRIPHLSCYALTVEPGTALDHLTRKKKVKEVASEDQARQFEMMTRYLREKGYEHYEISNFAMPGKRSRHNSAYWNGVKYLGLGPSAHSYNGIERQWNVSNNSAYIKTITSAGTVPHEVEVLSTIQNFNEYLMTSLRTIEGVDLRRVKAEYGSDMTERLRKNATRFEENRWLIVNDDSITLTNEGKLFADGITAGLFEEEDHTSTASMFLNASRG